MIPTKHLNHFFLFGLFFLFLMGCSGDEDTAPIEEEEEPEPIEVSIAFDYRNTFGGSDEDDSYSVATTPDGGFIVASSTQSTDGDVTDKSANDIDFWITKFSSSGNIQWKRTYGGSENDDVTDIQPTNDGGYIVIGSTRSSDGDVTSNAGFYDFWLLKLNSSGDIQWNKNHGYPGNDQGLNIIQTNDGGYFASGFLDVTASGGQGNDTRNPLHGVGEFWGIKTDANGDYLWRRYFGGTNNDRSYDALQTSDGGFLMIGSSESNDYNITDNKGSYDYWVVRINGNGDLLWAKSFGGSGIDVGYAVTQTSDGNYVIVGDTRSDDQDVTEAKGNADGWAVKFTDSGEMLWQKSYGGSEFDTFRGVEELSNGNLIFSGSTRSSNGDLTENKGQSDAWIVVSNPDGEILNSTTYGGSQIEFINALDKNAFDEVIIVGNSESSDQDITENKGGKDILVTKIKVNQ